MLDPLQIVPQKNIQLSTDIDRWVDKEVYGINKCPKSFSQLYAEFLLLSVLGNNPTTIQQQCFLSKLLSNT